ncbi:Uncharacterized protein APZ42_033858 [Daphnia magna]|uniref:Uncharacterized protein n=1 Tax=Daphnia magna TaxID=35525 RepID=A0A164KN92_9CRUS|nr:Uncharacterized protein APZ42_033858 [Daphnia magna]
MDCCTNFWANLQLKVRSLPGPQSASAFYFCPDFISCILAVSLLRQRLLYILWFKIDVKWKSVFISQLTSDFDGSLFSYADFTVVTK